MTWKVLVSAPYMQPVIDEFRPFFKENGVELVVPDVQERLEEADLLPIIADIDGVICGDDRFTKKVFAQARKLKVIAKWGTGIDSIDQTAAKEMNVSVCNTPNAFTNPVADSVLGYILSFARKIPWSSADIKAGIWQKIPGVALNECTLGIVGVGNIGKAVARRAIAFGMTVLGTDLKQIDPNFVKETGIKVVGKEELLAQADFVSINCDLNPSSYHLISDRDFSLMKMTSYLINTARGPIIDEPALLRALQGKMIAGAALDVYEAEPLPKDSLLRQMDNCLFAAHNANSSPTAWAFVHQNTINNLMRVLKGNG